MSRHFLLALFVCLLSLVVSVSSVGPVIVEDNFSNAVFLPTGGVNSNSQVGYSISQPAVAISPYTLTVHSYTPTTAYYINNAFGQATLTSTAVPLGAVDRPVVGVGSHVYHFTIPTSGRLLFNMSYTSGVDHVQVVISAANPHGSA